MTKRKESTRPLFRAALRDKYRGWQSDRTKGHTIRLFERELWTVGCAVLGPGWAPVAQTTTERGRKTRARSDSKPKYPSPQTTGVCQPIQVSNIGKGANGKQLSWLLLFLQELFLLLTQMESQKNDDLRRQDGTQLGGRRGKERCQASKQKQRNKEQQGQAHGDSDTRTTIRYNVQ